MRKGESFTIKVTIYTTIAIDTQPQSITFTEGSITGSLRTVATVSDGSTPSYQWYSCSDLDRASATVINRENSNEFTIPAGLAEGIYYYFCRVSAMGAPSLDSGVAVIKVNAIPTYTITYAAGGGSGIMDDDIVTDGQPFILPDNEFGLPVGMRFKAWSVDGVEYQPGYAYTFTANSTVTAIWEAVVVTPEPVTYRLPYRLKTSKGGIK